MASSIDLIGRLDMIAHSSSAVHLLTANSFRVRPFSNVTMYLFKVGDIDDFICIDIGFSDCFSNATRLNRHTSAQDWANVVAHVIIAIPHK